MRKLLILTFLVACLIFSSPVFASASTSYEWAIQTGNRYDYSWTVEDSTKTVIFQENFYVIVDEVSPISEGIDPTDVWTLSETGFDLSMFWSNGTAFDVSSVPQPFGFKLLPVGNWSQLIDAFPIDAGFLNDDTIFAYEYYDLTLGTGVHKEVKFHKINGVLELYHMHQFVDNVAVYRLDVELLSSTPIATPTSDMTPTDSSTPSPTTPDQDIPMELLVLVTGGSLGVIIVVVFVIKQRA